MCGLMCGRGFRRLAHRLTTRQTILRGYLVMGVARLAVAAEPLACADAAVERRADLRHTFGMSLAMPCLTLLALDPFPAAGSPRRVR